jgi:hypothetical protein
MNFPATQRASKAASFALVALETLPCGCVAGVYQAHPTVVELELVEAKGPHCIFMSHQTGHVVRLGGPDVVLDEDEAVA